MSTDSVHARVTSRWRAKPRALARLALVGGCLTLLAVLVLGCASGQQPVPGAPTPGSPSGGTAQVAMRNSQFQPAQLTVAAGTTVVWTNEDGFAHTITAGTRGNPSGLFDEQVAAGGQFSFTFQDPGTYDYYCNIHPGMDGTILVQ